MSWTSNTSRGYRWTNDETELADANHDGEIDEEDITSDRVDHSGRRRCLQSLIAW